MISTQISPHSRIGCFTTFDSEHKPKRFASCLVSCSLSFTVRPNSSCIIFTLTSYSSSLIRLPQLLFSLSFLHSLSPPTRHPLPLPATSLSLSLLSLIETFLLSLSHFFFFLCFALSLRLSIFLSVRLSPSICLSFIYRFLQV